MISAVVEATGLTRARVVRALAEADGRSSVRTLFKRHWPEDEWEEEDDVEWKVEELGRQRAAAARDDASMISTLVEVTKLTRARVARKLAEADGRYYVRTLFKRHWPDEVEEEE
jgi:3-hydroxyisobutyrate dehydrogenase-like beta-hydroxyacid dehydrogenase